MSDEKTNNTKVRYKGERVNLDMSLENYTKLLGGLNDLRSVLSTIAECNDLWLTEVNKLETLSYTMFALGYERGESYYSDVKLPTDAPTKGKAK